MKFRPADPSPFVAKDNKGYSSLAGIGFLDFNAPM
jgi:hypothetical protein